MREKSQIQREIQKLTKQFDKNNKAIGKDENHPLVQINEGISRKLIQLHIELETNAKD